jgi:hypothetical protein
VIIQYWHEEVPPEDVAAALESFAQHNPGVPHVVFNRSTAAEFIAHRYGAREADAFRTCAMPEMQADYLRCCAVHAFGGFYSDTDFRCRAGVGDLLAGPAPGVLFGRPFPAPKVLEDWYRWPYPVGPFAAIGNDMFAFRGPGHRLLELAIQIATANIEHRIDAGRAGAWLVTGPGIFTSLYLLDRLGSTAAFLEYAAQSVLAPSAELVCEAVGGQADGDGRLFDGLEVRPRKDIAAWAEVAKRSDGASTWFASAGGLYR